jgi:hypothetical protein
VLFIAHLENGKMSCARCKIGNLSAEIAARCYLFNQAHRALSPDGIASQVGVSLRWRANYLSFHASSPIEGHPMRYIILKIETTGYEPSTDRAQLEQIAAELNSDALDEPCSDRWIVLPEDDIRIRFTETA